MAVVRARSSPPYGLFGAVAFAAIATAAAVILYEAMRQRLHA